MVFHIFNGDKMVIMTSLGLRGHLEECWFAQKLSLTGYFA